MVVLAGTRTELGVSDLPVEVRGDTTGLDAANDDHEAARQRCDRICVANLRRRCDGSHTAAALRAGTSRGHLHRRRRELGCDIEAARGRRRANATRDDHDS